MLDRFGQPLKFEQNQVGIERDRWFGLDPRIEITKVYPPALYGPQTYLVPWRDGPVSAQQVTEDMWALYYNGIPVQWLVMVAELVKLGG